MSPSRPHLDASRRPSLGTAAGLALLEQPSPRFPAPLHRRQQENESVEITEFLDELTYRVLASAESAHAARARLAVIAHWAAEQDERLAGERALRIDSPAIVAEALAKPCDCGLDNYFGPCPALPP